ncbi:MAG: S-layer homology domain-containing protein, partial [Firmicutes bacterium]|nr:S-layer homology domain-containing protein [Bacillota bacterium]
MNFKTNVLSIIIAFTLVLTGAAYYGTGFASAEAGGTAFTDLPTSHWAYSSVQKMQAKGIVKGYPDGSFGPSKTVTYGEFIKMAVVAVKGTDDITNAKDATHWASGYYKYAIENGIFHSGQIAEKQLGSTIPRDDMALICANAANLSEVNMKEVADKIPDVDKTTRNEYQIAQAYAEGLITGYEDGSFHPYGTLTRAEASTVILRIIDKSARKVPDWAKEAAEEATTTQATSTKYDSDGTPVIGSTLIDLYGTYKVVDTASTISNWADFKAIYTSTEANICNWTPKMKVYSNKLEYKIKVDWEKGTQFAKDFPDSYEGPFVAVRIPNIICCQAFTVKDGKILRRVGSLSSNPNYGTDFLIYNEPSSFDYILFMDSMANVYDKDGMNPSYGDTHFEVTEVG